MGTSTDALLAFGFDLGEDLPEAWFPEEEEDDFDHEGHIEDLVEKDGAPVELVVHCSYQCPQYFLSLKGTKVCASRGYPEAVEMGAVEPEKIEQLKAFCERHSIEWQEPKWHIFSLWGV